MDKIKKLLDENKSLKILLPVLALALIAMIIVWANSLGQGKKNSVLPADKQQTNVTQTAVPSMPGELDTSYFPGSDEDKENRQSNLSPYIGAPKFKGATRSSDGIIWGILEFTNGSVKVKIGDEVGGYLVKEISDDLVSVTLEKDSYESILQITTRNSN